jgi:hypothetical protein
MAQLLALGLTGRALGQMRLDCLGPMRVQSAFAEQLQFLRIGTIH